MKIEQAEQNSQAKVLYSEHLDTLNAQGFENNQINLRMLIKNKGNITATISDVQQVLLGLQQKNSQQTN